MADFTAKDVQALRQATGAGMMDAKKALVENGGDAEAAATWLREKGLAKAATRSDRENTEGCVAVVAAGNAAAVVEVKCETDFVAKSDQFKDLADRVASAVAQDAPEAVEVFAAEIDDLKVTLKENIELGRIERLEAGDGQVVGTYTHVQAERGVNGVAVVLDGGTAEQANELCLHIAFTKPDYLDRTSVPAADIEQERETLLNITKAEGKPEQAWDKIVEGRLGGWFAERCLLDQKFVRDESQTVEKWLGGASIVSFAQVVIGG